MAGQHLPPDHAAGDANTVGGYAAVHARPAAFEGSDGVSYTVELMAGESGDRRRPWGAYLFFVRWSAGGATGPTGHLESDFLAWGGSEAEALTALGRLPLQAARAELERLIAGTRSVPDRPSWQAMRGEARRPRMPDA
ncbi:MAG TPA: hypothetical protein VNA89_12630 [Gemmatimonadaceae bacterium]|nr:hypothetical protein [Gemmatimonadaceae bacterium]